MFGIQNIGTPEIIIVVVVLLLIFGPKKLPEFAKSIKEFLGILKGEEKTKTSEETKKKK
jgi:TatA/E family protein of Tat protein translocase